MRLDIVSEIKWSFGLLRRMFSRFNHRSYELENIDTGTYTPEEYEGCLAELRFVNRYMGDRRALRRSLIQEIRDAHSQRLSVLDVAAGSGELLRVVADWAMRSHKPARLVGLELNARSARAIIDESRDSSNIRAVRGDAFKLPFPGGSFDYVICSLFTHHFKDEGVLAILNELSRVVRNRVFVIDLHRHPIAYYFYTTIGHLFLHNRLLREDGALSILRSFRPRELRLLAEKSTLTDIGVQRCFPFRLILSGAPANPR